LKSKALSNQQPISMASDLLLFTSMDRSSSMDRPVEQRKWWLRPPWLIASFIALALIALLFGTLNYDRTARVSLAGLEVAEVKKSLFRDFVPLRGRVVPKEVIYIDAVEGGRVERIAVESGDFVSVGQPLIEFGNTELQLDVIERETRLIEQINNLRTTQRELEEIRVQNERALRDIDYNTVRLRRVAARRDVLANRGATSVEEREQSADELAYYQALRPLLAETSAKQEAMRVQRLPEITDALTKLQQNLVITRAKLDNLIVRAPITGRVTDLELKVGESCARGQRLAQVVPNKGFKVSADVDEFYVGRFRVGDVAQFEFRQEPLELSVARISPKVVDGRFAVDLQFTTEPPDGLTAGQAVQGKLQLGEDSSAVVVPAGAFLEKTGGDWIFVVAKDGRSATRRQITAGRRSAEQFEIKAGVQPGERVIISDYRGLERVDRIDLTE
jgi:HlyD family secretion protein